VNIDDKCHSDCVVEISSKNVTYNPSNVIVLAKNMAFSESEVIATILKPESEGKYVKMMTWEES
jgi:hypothetical protein